MRARLTRRLYWQWTLMLLVLSHPVYAQRSAPDTLHALRIHSNIRLDGVLDEPAWQAAPAVTNFTQRELSEGEPASEHTAVAVVYDEHSVYFGIWCYDREPNKIVARKMQRDFNYRSEDNFQIVVDTFHDRRNGYRFVINPNGARSDALVLDNGRQINRDWDGVWNVKTQITDKGWFAELQIPFSTLRFSAANEQVWGVNFERNIRRKREQVLWQAWSRDSDLEQVSRAGTLVGIQGVSQTSLLELKPYGLGGLESPRHLEQHRVGKIGGDLYYLPTPTSKLSLTVNPDFAQVESDRAQINLTRFSLFFPEKREFFLEGRNYFDFGLGNRILPFYSRRIGLSEDRQEIPIIVGGRLLAKKGSTTLGGLLMQTAEKDSMPTTNFGVLRWKQDILKQSTIGVIAATRADAAHFNATYGFDFLYSTSHFLGDKNLAVGAALAQSYTSNRRDKTGTAQRVFVSFPTDFVEFEAAWVRAGRDFNPEVGFLRRRNFQEYFALLRFNPRPSFLPWVRRLQFKPLDINYFLDDATRQWTTFFSEFRPLGVATKSGESLEFNIQYLGENLAEPFEIHDGVVIPTGAYWFTRYEFRFRTFGGRPLSVGAGVAWGEFYNGTRTAFGGRVVARLNRYLSLTADFRRNRVRLPAGSFDIDEIGGRADFAFSPNLFGAIFGQWNSDDQEVVLNFRINWIPTPGTDLFLVLNHSLDTLGDAWTATNTTVLSKLVWRFVM